MNHQRLLDFYAKLPEGTVFVRTDDILTLARARSLQERARIFDLGCGQGQAALALAQAYPSAEVIGIDISPAQIERAQRAAANQPNVRFFVSDWRDFALPSDGVDLLLATQVLQFMADEREFVEYLAAGLAANGHLLLRTLLLPDEEPGRSFVTDVMGQIIVGSVRFYSERDVTELLREVGLSRFRIDKEEMWLDALPPDQAQLLARALQQARLTLDDVQPWFWSGTISAVRR